MARPSKQGLEYFPLDCHTDDKFKFIEVKYKLEGFAIVVKLLQKVYSYGYWYRWGDDEALLFADENRTNVELVNEVLAEAIERGIFNKKMYQEHGVLTSRGIQKRYRESIKRRKEVEVIDEYLLVDELMSTLTPVNAYNNPENVDINPQSKVKESKVKESKVNNIYNANTKKPRKNSFHNLTERDQPNDIDQLLRQKGRGK